MRAVRIPPKIEELSLKWIQKAPFFSEFTMRFYYRECERGEMPMPTMGVSIEKGRLYLYYDKEFLEQIPKNILEFVMIHEIMHIISLHVDRKLPQSMVWNVATDMIINDSITTLHIGGKKVKCWKEAAYLNDAIKQGYKGPKISERLYEWLMEKYEDYKKQHGESLQQPSGIPQDGSGQGDPQQGSGQGQPQQKEDQKGSGGSEDKNQDGKEGKKPQPGKGKGNQESPGFDWGEYDENESRGDPLKNMFRSMDVHEWLQKELSELDKKSIEEIVKSARTRSWGTMSGEMVEMLDELTRDRTLNWKQLLRRYTRNWVYGKGPVRFRTWSKRNRRQLPLPGYKRPHNEIVIAVDTSGSIDQEYFQMFFKEIESIAKDKDRLTIVECDAEINKVYDSYKRGDWKKIKMYGRGGTAFGPVFDWMVENKKDKAMCIYFTDLCAPWQFDNHGIRTLWVTPEMNDAPKEKGPTVHITKEEKR